MKITYTNTRGDVTRFLLNGIIHSRFQQISFVIYLGITTYLFRFVFSTGTVAWIRWFVFISTQIVAVLAYAGLTVLSILLAVSPSRNKAVITEHELTLTDESVTEQTAYNRNEHFWRGIYRVAENGTFIMIYVSQHGAYIVPKRAFASPEKAREFYQYARARWEATR